MYEFMLDYFAKMRERAFVRYNDPPFHVFKESLHTSGNDERQCICLFEMGVGTVKDQRYSLENIVIEFILKILITLFGKKSSHLRQRFHLRIKIDIEMLGPENMPSKLIVLNFIPAKIILCLYRWDKA